MERKAQFSFDLMLVIGIMLLLFLSLFQYYSSKSEAAQIIRQKTSAKGISEGLASGINAVLQAGNGSEANFSMPETLADGSSYSITAANRRVEVYYANSSASSLFLTSNVLSIDLNSRKGSDVKIANVDGTILLQ